MAPDAPEAVADIILDIPYTDNISVLTDLADAVCAIPPDHSVRLIDLAKQWASGPYAALMLLPERMGRLIGHLADGGYTEAALDLSRVVLKLKDPTAESGSGPRTRPEGYLRDWEYKEIIRLRLAALVRACGVAALRLLCGLLDQALRIEWSADEEASAVGRFREDYSGIWRSNLAAADHPGSPDIRDTLVGAVRDAALQIVGNQPDLADQVAAELEGWRWIIFWRISLDILREAAQLGLPLTFSRLTDQDLANEPGLELEYLELLGAVFVELSSDCQGKILELIDAGPDTTDLRDDLDADWYGRRWRWQMLASIKDNLPSEREDEWQRLSAEFGREPELRRHGMITPWEGHPEAVGVERLRVMPIAEIVELINEFEPGAGFKQPSAEDLARELTQIVGADPVRFAIDIRSFDDVDLVYKAGLVRGLRDGAEAGYVFVWGPVLDLCQRVMSETGVEYNHDTASVRREVTDLLRSGLALGLDFPFELRPNVWELLSALIEDRDPSGLTSESSPYEQAINMTRGRAMEAAVRYGVWVYNHTTRGVPDRIFSLDAAPELREALERHLDPEVESSLAVRSIYGVWLPTLNGLDPGWVSEHLGILFPDGDVGAKYRQATWEAYMCYARLNLSMLNLLRDEYARSIELLGLPNLEERRKPDEQLGTHLRNFYWHGRLALDEPMLVRFFEIASDNLRSDVLASMGQDLRAGEEPLEDDVTARLKALWEWRIEIARGGPQDNYRAEMAAFGWTFASGELGISWGLSQLEATLNIAGQAAIDHLVAERLALLATENPSETVRCLALMVDSAEEDWQIHHWATDVETILIAALQSADEEASRSARALTNRLGARGFLQFAKLLENE